MKPLILFLICISCAQAAYQPLAKHNKHQSQLTSLEYSYKSKARTVPLKLYLPVAKNAPTILLSHGLGGSREMGAYLAKHWANRGFAVIAMQHAGSDETIWKNTPRVQRFRNLKKAASFESFESRTADVKATLDQLNKWNSDPQHALHGLFNLGKVAIGGHSFGAITSQAVSGQSFPLFGAKWTDPKIDAALMLSPSPSKNDNDAEAFGKIQLPWMLMTGTKDSSAINPSTTPIARQKVYQHLPSSNNKYQVVLKNAAHMAFSDRTMIGSKHRNPNHHKVILALSTAFFETHLNANADAKQWLHSDKPKQTLQQGDTWEKK